MADGEKFEVRTSIRRGIQPRVNGLYPTQTSIWVDGLSIRFIFRVVTIVIAAIAFFAIVGISFIRVKADELTRANASVRTEVDYLCLQLNSLGKRAEAFGRALDSAGVSTDVVATADPDGYALFTDPIGSLLEGYTLAQTGTVVLAEDDIVVASDDGRIPVGSGLRERLGDESYAAIGESLANGQMVDVPLEGALADSDDQRGYLMAGQQGNYTIVIIEPERMVYHDLVTTLGREATVALVVLVVMSVVVDYLLVVGVARRIDKTNKTLERIVSGDLDARVVNSGSREFRSLAQGINVTVDALKGWIGEAERRMEQDLATARRIQEGALPQQFPALPNVDAVDLFASMDPAREVGGDFYDFFELDEHTIAFLVADVSGKGIPGALFMMSAKTEIQNLLRAGMGLADAVHAANAYLCDNNEAGMFVTMWVATLDWRTGELAYVNAGHNFPLLRHGRGGDWEWLKQKCGLFLGTFETARYRQESLTLVPGDELLLYTDGVNEAFDVDEHEYGNDRLEAFLARHADLGPTDLVPALRADVAAWAEGAEQSDDVTILALEMR
ncbi:MAG: SpoIIE family protein phosphatase [Atopobiaceae bacterium]|nr:SpoIIE family protein phosphatase [Atopobiaceae bacterium]